MRKFTLITIAIISIIVSFGFWGPKKKKDKKDGKKENFSGIITYMGNVSRIPDSRKTNAKLHEFESRYDLYLNSKYAKKVEDYKTLGLSITITEGINKDFFQQTVFSKGEKILVIATPKEIKDYQLLPKYIKTNSIKVTKAKGKKRIKGYECQKMISNIITSDNIRIQLIAWYTPELYIKGYEIPFFPGMNGIPLLFDTYTGEHVVTYRATKIKKKDLHNGYFGRPMQVVPMTFTEYIRKMQSYDE